MISKIRKVLNSRDAVLAASTFSIIEHVTPLLWHSLSTFPSGTSHTPEHTHAVEHITGMLLADEILSQLSNTEIQIILLACHFHDLGMAGTDFDNQSASGQEQARKDQTDHQIDGSTSTFAPFI